MYLTDRADLGESKDEAGSSISAVARGDLSRNVYGVLGTPIDALDREAVFKRILAAALEDKPFLLSTPNVNFMIQSKMDTAFRDSLLRSDLCCVDGMPIVWVARLLDVPVKERVSGSDLFDTIRSKCEPSRPFKVFLFGGGDGVAEAVCQLINARPDGMHCVGWLNPGFGTIEEMSSPEIIQTINDSKADMLAVFLSAKKAQSWLVLNHDRLVVPVRGQFGATINYQAGIVRRAPIVLQRFGLEWLWRIKEEPYLWRRYWHDGLSLINLVITHAFPLAIDLRWRAKKEEGLSIEIQERGGIIVVCLIGNATKNHIMKITTAFSNVLLKDRGIELDVSRVRSVDARFFGLLLMVRKQLEEDGEILKITGISKKTARLFKLNRFDFLLESTLAQRRV
jgi:N-acetylglucosaminyldiphosphoundecaprenol N-acetyl-beta-D-mannosaminyltransferase